ncbi:hypothetical protein HKX48_000735, partial [Thoreauomyces humboldtii]
ANAAAKKEAKEKGISFNLKREPLGPVKAHHVSTKGNRPTTITPVAYEALV